MSLTFLCKNHRVWFSNQPEQAVAECYKAYEAGLFFYKNKDFKNALMYSGNAYEMAEIMATDWLEPPANIADWLTSTSQVFVRVLRALGRDAECGEVYQRSVSLLGKLEKEDIGDNVDTHLMMAKLAEESFQHKANLTNVVLPRLQNEGMRLH